MVKDYIRHKAINYHVRQMGDIHRTATLIIPSDADKKSFGFEMAD